MRRSAIADVGGFDESFAAMFEDQLFFAKILLHFPVFVSGSCWAKYRQHHTSASTSPRRRAATRLRRFAISNASTTTYGATPLSVCASPREPRVTS